MSNPEEVYIEIKEVPEELKGTRRGMAVHYLLKHADRLEKCHRPKQRSIWRAYFDGGAYKGSFVYKFRHAELTPLLVYLTLANTGWPGLQLGWLEEIAAQRMASEFTVKSGGSMTRSQRIQYHNYCMECWCLAIGLFVIIVVGGL